MVADFESQAASIFVCLAASIIEFASTADKCSNSEVWENIKCSDSEYVHCCMTLLFPAMLGLWRVAWSQPSCACLDWFLHAPCKTAQHLLISALRCCLWGCGSLALRSTHARMAFTRFPAMATFRPGTLFDVRVSIFNYEGLLCWPRPTMRTNHWGNSRRSSTATFPPAAPCWCWFHPSWKCLSLPTTM